jgi:16S rRNA processing protein RimM
VKRKPTPQTPTQDGARQAKHHLVAGRIVRPHGVRGQVVVDPISGVIERVRPGMIARLAPSGRTARVASLQPHQGRHLLALEGFESRTAAENLRGEALEFQPDDIGPLPEGVYFRWQIVGLRAVTDDGADLGEVVEVLETGANDVYEIRRSDGRTFLIPAISSVVREIDLDGGTVRVHLLPGLVDPV